MGNSTNAPLIIRSISPFELHSNPSRDGVIDRGTYVRGTGAPYNAKLPWYEDASND